MISNAEANRAIWASVAKWWRKAAMENNGFVGASLGGGGGHGGASYAPMVSSVSEELNLSLAPKTGIKLPGNSLIHNGSDSIMLIKRDLNGSLDISYKPVPAKMNIEAEREIARLKAERCDFRNKWIEASEVAGSCAVEITAANVAANMFRAERDKLREDNELKAIAIEALIEANKRLTDKVGELGRYAKTLEATSAELQRQIDAKAEPKPNTRDMSRVANLGESHKQGLRIHDYY